MSTHINRESGHPGLRLPSGFRYQMTVTPLWTEMRGCPWSVPDISCGWSTAYPQEVHEACRNIWGSLYFEAMDTQTKVFPTTGDEWPERLKDAVNIRNEKSATALTSPEHSLESSIWLDFQSAQGGENTQDILEEDGPRLVLWAGDPEYPGVWSVNADPKAGGPLAAVSAEGESVAGGFDTTAQSGLIIAQQTTQDREDTMKLINRWSRKPDDTYGSAFHVASTAGYVIRALGGKSGLHEVRPLMLESRAAFLAAGGSLPEGDRQQTDSTSAMKP